MEDMQITFVLFIENIENGAAWLPLIWGNFWFVIKHLSPPIKALFTGHAKGQ